MNNLWIIFVIIYSLLKGSRDGMKKAALKKSSSTEILFFYTLIGLVLILPFSKDAFSLAPIYVFYTFLKSLVVCVAWLCALWALKSISVSLYGVMDLSRMVFATLLGVFVIGERMTVPKGIGFILVITGLLLINSKRTAKSENTTVLALLAALANSFLNATSGVMDKVLTKNVSPSQLQFWFMLFLVLIYGSIILIRREKITIKHLKTNYWVPIMSATLVLGDRVLFMANASPESQVTLMTIIKQSSVFVTVLSGWIFFKEKNIPYKLMCAGIVLTGIFIALL